MSPVARNRAVTAITLLVVAFATGAFVRTQALKQEDAPIAGIRFDKRLAPGCDCPRERVELSFTLQPPQAITATVVSDDDEQVRTLVEGDRLGGGRETLRWDGTDDEDRVVADGAYRLRVELTDPDRTITIPTEVEVEAPGQGAARPGRGSA